MNGNHIFTPITKGTHSDSIPARLKRGLPYVLYLGIGLFLLLTLIGCSSSYHANINIHSEKNWEAEVSITLDPQAVQQLGGKTVFETAIQEDLNANLSDQGVTYKLNGQAQPDDNGAYTYIISMQGQQGMQQLKHAIFFDDKSVAGMLEGPASLQMSGQVKNGETLTIVLQSNPSTGYAWVENETATNFLKQIAPPTFQSDAKSLGMPGRQSFYFKAITDGQTEIRFLYKRPWLDSTPPTRTISIQAPELSMIANLAWSETLAQDYKGNQALIGPSMAEPEKNADTQSLSLPASFDWRTLGKVTSVKDQGGCGSCWAFSTVGPFEANLLIKSNKTTDLSEQYLVSCNTDGWSCNGGWFAHDYHLYKRPPSESRAGAVLESDFPYAGEDVSCAGSYTHPYRISAWKYISDDHSVPSVASIKAAIYNHGPISAAVCVGSAFQAYTGGIFQTNEVCSSDVNHAVVLVGWNDTKGTNGVWILKNSWGPAWGENGYIRIGYGVSKVGYAANYIIYATKPGAFNKSNPANGAIKRPTNPTLKWATSSGASSYEYCIDKTNNNSCDSNTWISTGTATNKTLSGLTPVAHYYWQVRAKNALGYTYANGSATAWWSFTVIKPSQAAVSLLTAAGINPHQKAIFLFGLPVLWNDVLLAIGLLLVGGLLLGGGLLLAKRYAWRTRSTAVSSPHGSQTSEVLGPSEISQQTGDGLPM